jgi:hypothetical protein
MAGSNRRLASLVKQGNPHVVTTHCSIHREMLVSKSLGDEMKNVLDDATKMVNFIKQRTIYSRMFKKLCENLEKQHINLLQNTEIRWLSRMLELKELQDYFQENSRPDFAKCFEDEEWPKKLSYLTDIFHHMNQLN